MTDKRKQIRVGLFAVANCPANAEGLAAHGGAEEGKVDARSEVLIGEFADGISINGEVVVAGGQAGDL